MWCRPSVVSLCLNQVTEKHSLLNITFYKTIFLKCVHKDVCVCLHLPPHVYLFLHVYVLLVITLGHSALLGYT